MEAPFSNLEDTLGYQFKDASLLEQALTHSSCDLPTGNNQRMEFLGDAVLDLIVANRLYSRFPLADEGALDRGRASIVNGRSLARAATAINLAHYLRVGGAHRKHHPAPSKAMLEDALEAIIGAAFLDGGLDAARSVIKVTLGPQIDAIELAEGNHNPKGKLQEWSQKHFDGAIPEYGELPAEGPEHDRRYQATVHLGERLLGTGAGSSKKAAETEAARVALDSIR